MIQTSYDPELIHTLVVINTLINLAIELLIWGYCYEHGSQVSTGSWMDAMSNRFFLFFFIYTTLSTIAFVWVSL